MPGSCPNCLRRMASRLEKEAGTWTDPIGDAPDMLREAAAQIERLEARVEVVEKELRVEQECFRRAVESALDEYCGGRTPAKLRDAVEEEREEVRGWYNGKYIDIDGIIAKISLSEYAKLHPQVQFNSSVDHHKVTMWDYEGKHCQWFADMEIK